MKRSLFLLACLFGSFLSAATAISTTYAVDSTWNTGYTAHILLTNSSSTPLNSWEAQFDLLHGQKITSLWNGTYVVNKNHVTVTNASWNGNINPGQNVSIGFAIDNPQKSATTVTGISATGEMSSNIGGAGSFPLHVDYKVENTWTTGFQALVIVRNNSSTPTTSWNTTFILPKGGSINSLWNGVYTANGTQITVTNPTWSGGGVIAPGGTTTFGMVVNIPAGGAKVISHLQANANGGAPLPPPSVPVAPVMNGISLTTLNSYAVSWKASPTATSYTLQEDTTSAFTHPQVVATGGGLSQAFSNKAPGTYYYRVQALNAAGNSPFSNVQSVTVTQTPPPLAIPSAPVLNTISLITPNSYTVSWRASTNATTYTLQEDTTNAFTHPQVVTTGAELSQAFSNKAPGTYYYRVQASNYAGNSPFSNVQSAIVTQTSPPLPTDSQILESYWESWNSTTPVTTIVNMKVDVINISFGTFQSTGSHTFTVTGVESDQATLSQLVTNAHRLGKKVKIAIGGASYPLQSLLKTVEDALGMAKAVTQYVKTNGLDGVDYDIEDQTAPHLQVALLQNTRTQLGNNYVITYTPASPASTSYPWDETIRLGHKYVDGINIMAYNYGSGYTYQGDTQALVNMGVPISKVVIGLMPGLDDTSKHTSVAHIQTAANYVKANKLRGIMFWDLNRDHENSTGLGVDAATNAAWSILH